MITINDHVKKLKIKDYAIYQKSGLEITVLMNDGRKIKLKTTGAMTLQELVDAIIERLEE